jgi:hypothetical protein
LPNRVIPNLRTLLPQTCAPFLYPDLPPSRIILKSSPFDRNRPHFYPPSIKSPSGLSYSSLASRLSRLCCTTSALPSDSKRTSRIVSSKSASEAVHNLRGLRLPPPSKFGGHHLLASSFKSEFLTVLLAFIHDRQKATPPAL